MSVKIPDTIRHVSKTQFGIARYYGCVTINGHRYTYDHETDTLTRDDVFRERLKDERQREEFARKEREKWQGMMFDAEEHDA